MAEGIVEPASARRQDTRFLILYALASAGGAIAYVPLLTILLPVRVEAMAGEESVRWLAYCAFFGAVSASLGNILFGWLSDITGNRRGWIVGGLVLSSALLLALTRIDSLPGLIWMLVAWQLCLNMMLGPLSAWAGDVVPDRQKGTLGGLLAFAPALGALSGTLVTIPGLAGADTRLTLVVVIVVALVLPVLFVGRPVTFPELMRPSEPDFSVDVRESRRARALVVRMWLARLLVQISEAALFAYLYLWFRTIAPGITDNGTAKVFGATLLVAVPLALLIGRWADRTDRPIMPLSLSAGICALALLLMAGANGLKAAMAGYAMFGLAASVFLALHTAQTLRVLPRPLRRGRDLGLFNLTNTVPSLIMPGLTLAMVPVFGFSGLFVLLCVLAAIAALLLLGAARPR
ncbi:MFS transporter [Aurantiacibacter spongiae]|uniref:MFS transporter n=1 Tax=Aurantiacibacter spongiae TaxID=2488860 RepID=A0A3N5CWL7_9SPHN|nr:MFS transporter [Aurantiacibacter spongiae]RPF71039.1 MFS transporter [Aurantiacibacter spongiae]